MAQYITEIVLRMRAQVEASSIEEAEDATLDRMPALIAKYVEEAGEGQQTADLFVEATHKDGRAIETSIARDILETARAKRAVISGSVRIPMRELMAVEDVRDMCATKLCGELLEEMSASFVEVSGGDAIIEVTGLPMPPSYATE